MALSPNYERVAAANAGFLGCRAQRRRVSPIICTVRAHGTMPNSLTTEASLKLGAIVIETFFKHYLERNSESSKATGSESSANTTLREQDLLWQESFEIIKVRTRLFFNVTHTTPLQSFLNQATKYVKST